MFSKFSEKKWLLESFEKHENQTWKQIRTDKKSCYIKLVNGHILIENNGVILHTVDLSGEGKRITVQYANYNIGIKSIDTNGIISKIRVRLTNGSGNKSGSAYCSEIIEEIKKFVPVFQHPSHGREQKNTKFMAQEFCDMVKGILSGTNSANTDEFESILPESSLKDIIDAFVLHPQFPDKVVEVWELLQSFQCN